MKKKLILAVVAAIATTITVSATTVTFVSWCGKTLYTVDKGDLPEDTNDYEMEAYYQDLNVYLCGYEGPYELIPEN